MQIIKTYSYHHPLLDHFNDIERLDARDINLVINAFIPQTSSRNEILITHYQVCDKLYFITKGMMRAYSIDEKGVERTRLISVENQFCSNWKSFPTLAENNEFIQCVEDCEYLCVNQKNLFDIIRKSDRLQRVYTKNLERVQVYNAHRIDFLTNLSGRNRLKKFYHLYPYLVNRLSNKLLASFLHLTPEHCSALKRELSL